jgi:hypothetical protein
MTKAVVIGQSHTVCMSAAASLDGHSREISIFRLRSGDEPHDANALAADDAIALVKNLSSDVSLFISILGSYHNIIGLVRAPVEFDFIMRGGGPLSETAHLIPQRVVADAFDHHLQTGSLVLKLTAAANGPVHVLACPPPKRDNEFMMKRLLAKWNKPYRGQDIAANGLNRPDLRLKLWYLECERLEAWARKIEVGFIDPPKTCFDAEGFLAEQFYAADATHANAEYGLLMLKLITSVADRRQGSE